MKNIFNFNEKVPLKILLIIVLFLVLIGNAYFGTQYFFIKNQLGEVSRELQVNNKIAYFQQLFVENVLKAEAEVPYEQRLELEKAVYATENNAIIETWRAFLASQTEQEAQKSVLDLLSLFANLLT